MRRRYQGQFFQPRAGLRSIEQRAWTCVSRCLEKGSLGDVPLPIPVEEWIEGPLDIRFGVTDLSHLGPAVLGAAFIKEREILISEKTLENEGRFRFTCAHELGHFVLHSRISDVFQETEAGDPAISTRYERQADQFAAAFLMPTIAFEQELFRICADNGLESPYCIEELMMPTVEAEWLWRKVFLAEISVRFGVSRAAALIRCGSFVLAATGRRLLSEYHQKSLKYPVSEDWKLESVRLVNGRPTRETIAGPTLFDGLR